MLALIVNPILNIKNNSGDIEQIIKNYTHGSLKEENHTFENNRESLENKVYEKVSNGYKENAGN